MSMFRLAQDDRPHVMRLLIIWVILSIIGIVAVLQIPIRAGDQSVQGADQTQTMTLMTVLATPIFIGVVMLIVYSAIYFRRTGTELVDGSPNLGSTRIQVAWIGISAIIVLFLAFFGTTKLASSNQAQAAGGTAPVAGPEMQVQVIAQQRYFTYRYADYGGGDAPHPFPPPQTPGR